MATSRMGYLSNRTGSYLKSLWDRREFAWFLALGTIKSRNASTTLGLFWWVLNPLLLTVVYYVVFVLIIPSARDIGYLMSGMFVFHFTAKCLTGGASSILSNSRLIVNLSFPRLILPISHVMESAVGFLASLVVLYAVVIPFNGIYPGPQIVILLAIFPAQIAMNLGLACLSARLAVPFRDIGNLLPYASRLWLYLSPVIWTPALLEGRAPQWTLTLIEANPMYSMISVYRAALLGYPFELRHLGLSWAWALLVGVLGVALFMKYEKKMGHYL